MKELCSPLDTTKKVSNKEMLQIAVTVIFRRIWKYGNTSVQCEFVHLYILKQNRAGFFLKVTMLFI